MEFGEKCFLLTQRDSLMLGIYRGTVTTRSGQTLAAVENMSGGRTYHAAPTNVFDFREGQEMLIHRRAVNLPREGYRATLQAWSNGLRFRVFHEAKHGRTGGHLLIAVHGAVICSCPCFADRGICKHSEGLPGLLYQRAHEERQTGRTRYADTYFGLAGDLGYQNAEASPKAHEDRHSRLEREAAVDFS